MGIIGVLGGLNAVLGIYLLFILANHPREDRERMNMHWAPLSFVVLVSLFIFMGWSVIEIAKASRIFPTWIYLIERVLFPLLFTGIYVLFFYVFFRSGTGHFLPMKLPERFVITLLSICVYWLLSFQLYEYFPKIMGLIFTIMDLAFVILLIILVYGLYVTFAKYIPYLKSGTIVAPINLVDIIDGFILSFVLYGFGLLNIDLGIVVGYRFMEFASVIVFVYNLKIYVRNLVKTVGT
jgi:hypothetical protein